MLLPKIFCSRLVMKVSAVFAISLFIGLVSVLDANASSMRRYREIDKMFDKCGLTAQLIGTRPGDDAAPAASLCINGSLATADPDYNRPLMSSTGTGIGTGVVGNCSLSGSGTAVNYDLYSFNITGCAVFPTEVTATLCGPAGCQQVGNTDTTLVLYRNVPAGDPLTGNGGLPSVFNPGSPCTNARAGQDDLGTTVGTTNTPGGSTCNQSVPANCVGPCTTPTAAAGLSGFRRQLGNGRFSLVVGGFGNTTVGNYNLYIDVPAAGCVVALAPSSANASVAGRVRTPDGSGLTNAVVSITDPQGVTRSTRTSAFGFYSFDDIVTGQSYVISVSSKRFQFQSQVVSVGGDLNNVDFNAESGNRL